MKTYSLIAIFLVGLGSGLPEAIKAADNQPENPATPRDSSSLTPADYVNVMTGKGSGRWMLAPGPWMPNGMVKLAPDNKVQGYRSGYDDTLGFVNCFSHIHEWTMAGLGMMPTVGPLRTHAGADETGYGSHFDKAMERTGIGFYDVLLNGKRHQGGIDRHDASQSPALHVSRQCPGARALSIHDPERI